MKILTSSNVAALVNLMLKNARGTTTTTNTQVLKCQESKYQG